MTKVASTLSGVTTTFVDMSYSNAVDETVEGESDEQRSEKEDQIIVDRVEAAITPDTKVSPYYFVWRKYARDGT
jgi:hypothetical protein